MNRKIIHHEKRSQERKKTNKTRPGQETAKRTREAARAVLNTIVCETALFPFSAWPRVLCASRVQPLISTDAGLSRCQVDDKWFGQPCFIFPRPPPPTQRTPVGPSGGAAPPARRVNRPRAAVGVVVPRGAAPALFLSLVTRTVHAGGHAAAAGRQGTSGALGTLRSNFRTRFYAGRPLEPPARCALSSRDVPRRPNGECRAPQAPRSRDGFDSRMRYIYRQ